MNKISLKKWAQLEGNSNWQFGETRTMGSHVIFQFLRILDKKWQSSLWKSCNHYVKIPLISVNLDRSRSAVSPVLLMVKCCIVLEKLLLVVGKRSMASDLNAAVGIWVPIWWPISWLGCWIKSAAVATYNLRRRYFVQIQRQNSESRMTQ